MSTNYSDHNLGDERETDDEKEIQRLAKEVHRLRAELIATEDANKFFGEQIERLAKRLKAEGDAEKIVTAAIRVMLHMEQQIDALNEAAIEGE